MKNLFLLSKIWVLLTNLLLVTSISLISFYIGESYGIEDNNFTNQDINELEIIVSKVKMAMPGTNMTFGVPLDNAKMHLLEAEMDLKENNIDGALIQLNLTSKAIKMHEKELADIVEMVEMIEKMNYTKQ